MMMKRCHGLIGMDLHLPQGTALGMLFGDAFYGYDSEICGARASMSLQQVAHSYWRQDWGQDVGKRSYPNTHLRWIERHTSKNRWSLLGGSRRAEQGV
jgi:hypothetical protein